MSNEPPVLKESGGRLRSLLMYGTLAILVALVVYSQFGGSHPLVGQAAPAFKLAALEGGAVDLREHLGKDVIVLDFWAVWCPPCREALPEVGALARELHGDGVAIYAVNQADAPPRIRELLNQLEIEGLPVLLDEAGEATRAYNIQSIPTIAVIDKQGQVARVFQGYGPNLKRSLRATIEKLREAPAPTQTAAR